MYGATFKAIVFLRFSKRAITCSARLKSIFAAASMLMLPSVSPAQEFNLSYGVDFTSNYISKGTTQTEDRPAIQPYIELSYGLVYAGLWASNVRFNGASDIELDIYVGVTPTWGSVDFDIGYAEYLYRDDSNDYAEAFIKADWNVSDRLTLGLDYYREVYADENWVYANASLSGLPWDFTLSGGLGSDFGSRDLSSEKNVDDIGLSSDLSANAAIDLRAYAGNLDDETLVVTWSFFN